MNCKAQPMPPSSGFPKGWTFVIDPTMPGYLKANAERSQAIPMEGLKIMSPNHDRVYYCAERAKSHYRMALAEASPKRFYQYIGAISLDSSSHGGTRCGACENCTKDACGQCARCKSSSGGVSIRCFQKVRRPVLIILPLFTSQLMKTPMHLWLGF